MKICAAFTSPSSSWDDVLGLFWGGLRSVTRLTALAKNCRFAATKKVTRLRRCIRIRALRRGGKLKSLPYDWVCDKAGDSREARLGCAIALKALRLAPVRKSVTRLRRYRRPRRLRRRHWVCDDMAPSATSASCMPPGGTGHVAGSIRTARRERLSSGEAATYFSSPQSGGVFSNTAGASHFSRGGGGEAPLPAPPCRRKPFRRASS